MRWSGRFAGYSFASLRQDLLSGLIVGIIAIPLGMAFAIASGVKPEYGIYTTIVAGILISLLGGSTHQIGGPTGAFIPVLLAIVMHYGYENLLIAGMLAGVMLVAMGLLRLGALIKYIPRPVTIGFTAGIAVIIFSGQIANFLGLKGLQRHEAFLPSMRELGVHLNTVNVYSVLTACICLAVILLAKRFLPRLPGSLLGIVVSTVVAALCFKGQLPTIESSFGAIPSTLPSLHLPAADWGHIRSLLGPAFVIAMLGGIESLLSAVVADGMTGRRHNSNRELVGQGIANIVTPLFGGIPATGAIARTATNIKSGAVSPLSGVIHGIVVLLVLLLLAPYASAIPLASMAPILMLVAWNMSERREFVHMLRMKTSDSVVLAITFLLTVLTTLTTAVEVGLLLALVLFVKRMSESLAVAKVLPDPDSAKVKAHIVRDDHDCPQIDIYTVEGPLFFGAATTFELFSESMLRRGAGVLVLRLGKVPFIDMTGEAYLANAVRRFQEQGGTVLVSGIRAQPLEMLQKSGLYARLGAAAFHARTGAAIDAALLHLDHAKCRGCRHFAFRECAALSQPQPAAPGPALAAAEPATGAH